MKLDNLSTKNTACCIETGYSPMAGARHNSGRATAVKHSILTILAFWLERTRQRRALLRLDDRMLKDIGLSRASAHNEGEKWFWEN